MSHEGNKTKAKPTEVCPLCERNAVSTTESRDKWSEVDCPHCGRFQIEIKLARDLRNTDRKSGDRRLSRYLRCHTRQEQEAGRVARLAEKGWRAIAEKHLQTSYDQKVQMAKDLCFERAGRYQKWIGLDHDDAPLVDDPFGEVFQQILGDLVNDRIVEFAEYVDDASAPLYRLGPNGRREAENALPHGARKPTGPGRPQKYSAEQKETLRRLVAQDPDWRANLESLCHALDQAKLPTLDRFLDETKAPSALTWIEDFKTPGRAAKIIKAIARHVRG